VRDLVLPPGVTVLTDPDEPLARVQPPRVEEELAAPAEAPAGEAAEGAQGAAGESGEDAG
jgi:hypothetical protein